MQAGAMDLPSIVTEINGCNEIIIDGENGLIIPSKDTNSLKNALLKLINNKSLRIKLSRNARKLIADRYDQKYVWSELLKEYQNLENMNEY